MDIIMKNISEINKYYKLREIRVETEKLLLDPRNPRINVGDDIFYTEKELSKVKVQKEIFYRINKKEHHIADLISNIKKSGFNSGISTFIVKEVPGTEKYLVIEGNRRTTAIKQVLLNQNNVPASIIRSLLKIKVQRLDYIANPYFAEEEIIDIILGKIHLSGPLAWGAMEKAYYIYKTYLRELKKEMGKDYNDYFEFDINCVKRTSEFFNFKTAEIIKNLKIYCVFSQLKMSGYEVDNDRYSLIDIAVNDKEFSKQYFDFDIFYEFSERGLDRFNTLCLENNCPITNPKNFKDFIKIYREGEKSDISAILAGSISIEEVFFELKRQKEERNFVKRLNDIKKKIEKLNIHEFKNSPEERKVTKEIIALLKEKLIPLFKDGSDTKGSTGLQTTMGWPKNIQEAIGMNSDFLQSLIVDTVSECKNGSCTRDSLPTRLLKFMGIISRGEPRQQFVDRVEKELAKLIDDNKIQPYKAKNKRLRVV
jgi:hypothetical protein